MRAVAARDGERCTFIGDHGHRCESRAHLEYDHIVPVARGGPSTADNLRLRCRAHNQLEAERAFGAGFMQRMREAKRLPLAPAPVLLHPSKQTDLIAGLRTLGYSATQAKWAATLCAEHLDQSLEALLKQALRHLAPAHLRRSAASSA